MSYEEKAGLLSFAKNMETLSLPRLSIPSLEVSDWPLDVRKEARYDDVDILFW